LRESRHSDPARFCRVRDALLRYVRDEYLTNPVLIGYSVGGFLALSMAATAPDLFAAVVSVDGLPFLPAVYDPAMTAARTAPMFGTVDTKKTATPGRYEVSAALEMAGTWRFTVEWGSPSRSATFSQRVE